ncbi:neuronal acetylcholine receptor subunit alpha-10-like isoform X2 [Haliotis rubra]|uniref:neuronal acetylcholine receptor subunit alpha-10-like isoform X2 n=1 Tax=Haliotis rubra TaxID=36100 RepID=UPI001EE5AC78|nr:neuronal acetylcholine receptor subunit alpha-10-like isoform X2 [Haliotis rubra]
MQGPQEQQQLPHVCGRMRYFFILLIVYSIASHAASSSDMESVKIASKEKQLVKKLLDIYKKQGKEGRPVVNTSDSIHVLFGLSLIQILDVDEKNQILKTNIWYQYEWQDVLLAWKKEEYDNITDIRIPSDKIWLPDILLYNFADDRLKEQRDALVVVYPDGNLLWMPQAIIRSSCNFDTKYFPFDEQTCTLKFGSWTYNGLKLDIHFTRNTTSMDLTDYIPSNEWFIIQNEAVRNVKHYACCTEPYPDLTFKLRIRRKVAFYTFILILPCALLSLLTLVIFWVPPESPAKLILGMNIFLAFFVLLLLLADSTPKAAASIPLIGTFFCLNMTLITLSTVLSCMVANMFFRGVRINRAPRWLRVFMIDVVARGLCLRNKIVEPDYSPFTPKKSWNTGRVGGEARGQYPYTDIRFAQVRLLDNGVEGSKNQTENGGDAGSYQSADDTGRAGMASGPLLDEIKAIRDILEKVRDKKAKMEEKEKYVREWRVIACVTDRMIFIFYLSVNIVGLGVIFLGQLQTQDTAMME